MKKILTLIFLLGLFLRLYQVGKPVFKEDEFTTVKAAAYIYHCQKDLSLCRHQEQSLKNKILAFLTANETIPNLAAEVYLWDFIKDNPSEIHHSRAWPYLYLISGVYQALGINEFLTRLVSVIAGSLLIIVGFWFSRALGSSVNSSLLFSGLLAFSFPLIDFSRHARFYSLYGLVFLLAVGLVYKSRWLLALPLLLLAYWLQMLTLILPIGLLVWAFWQRGYKLAVTLIIGLVAVVGLSRFFGVEFLGSQFLAWAWPSHWYYLNWWWLAAITALVCKREKFVLSIVAVYLLVLTFFTRPAPGAAYTLMLWPLSLWALLNWQRWLAIAAAIIVMGQFTLGINYLYFGRDDRAQIKEAYQKIIGQYQAGDKIYAIQLRDYYLQDLPAETEVVDLRVNQDAEFSGSGFVVWEQEKADQIKPETIKYIRENFQFLGSGGVEIYSWGK